MIIIYQKEIISKLIMTCGTKAVLFERILEAIRQFGTCSVGYDWFPIEGGLHDYKPFDAGLRYALQTL